VTVAALPGSDNLRASTARRLSCAVRLFALVLRDGPLALELFASSGGARAALAQVVRDEPGFRELLEIRELAADGTLNKRDRCSLNQLCAVPADADHLRPGRSDTARDRSGRGDRRHSHRRRRVGTDRLPRQRRRSPTQGSNASSTASATPPAATATASQQPHAESSPRHSCSRLAATANRKGSSTSTTPKRNNGSPPGSNSTNSTSANSPFSRPPAAGHLAR
jgi:hypothetical protein